MSYAVEKIVADDKSENKSTNDEIRAEIMALLDKPTTKEKWQLEEFQSRNGSMIRKYCTHTTKEECLKYNLKCDKRHFKKIILPHTDLSLGDCQYLSMCFNMNACKCVHYENDEKDEITFKMPLRKKSYPPQWIQCDLRYFDFKVLGKFSVVMADPPWDIQMDLPYGTMPDVVMKELNVSSLQDDGYIFLWVTGRAMELGRECLKMWGYEKVDELIWVKTNQLQKIIRTGRTGHWLNHSKEHCLIGVKGNLPVNKGLDCDVIVSELRDTSRKPDEIYGIIERLSPGTRKIELFGRVHNVRPNWVTIGNQLPSVVIVDPKMKEAFYNAYPNGSCPK